MIIKKFKKNMDKFIKQFLPSASQEETPRIVMNQKNDNEMRLPTPPNTPLKETSVVIESEEITIVKKKSSTPTLKKKFIQASRSLFSRSFESKSMEIENNNGELSNGSVKNSSFKNKFEELKINLQEIHSHFEKLLLNSNKSETANNVTLDVLKVTNQFCDSYEKCLALNEKLIKNAKNYDYSVDFAYNGYRTLNSAFEKCCLQSLNVVKSINKEKNNYLFQMKFQVLTSSFKEYETWGSLMEKFQILFEIADEMQEKTAETNSLLIDQSSISAKVEKSLFLVASTKQQAFFGRSCAFQVNYCFDLYRVFKIFFF
jgi:hypothetical protein